MNMTMLKNKHGKRILSIATAAAAATAASAPAQAGSVSVQQFAPAHNSTYTLTEDAKLDVAPQDPTWTGRRLFFSAGYNWINDALIEYNADRTQRVATLVDGVQTIDLGVGVFLAREFSLDFAAPLNLIHMPSADNRFAFGDSRVFAKWRLTDEDSFVSVALIPTVYIPTGDTSLFLSDGGTVGGGLSLAIERDFGPVLASVNFGYRYSPNAQFDEIDYRQRLPMALGLYMPLNRHWGLNAEAAGSLALPNNAFNNPGEVYGGARYQFARGATALGGVSFGTVNGQAGNDVRVVVGLRFSPIPDPVYVAPAPAPAPAPVVAKAPAKPRVVFTRKEIHIAEEIQFEHDSARLTNAGRDLLNEVADVMKKNHLHYKQVRIEGYTNELGSYPYNQRLSERRAASVRKYLISRGIEGSKMASRGYGKTRPKLGLKGLSRDERLAANRRVEFKVIN
jgi:outer membrane protein OmpA-like peptidoglycan-associated protein